MSEKKSGKYPWIEGSKLERKLCTRFLDGIKELEALGKTEKEIADHYHCSSILIFRLKKFKARECLKGL